MAPPTPPPATRASAADMKAIRAQLFKDRVSPNRIRYLGDSSSDILEGLVWVRYGNTDILVHTDEAEKYESMRALHANDPTENPAPEAPTSAMFSAVCRISNRLCFFNECGGWNGPSRYAKTLKDVKMTALMDTPDVDTFTEDWDTVTRNHETIIRSKRTEGVQIIKGAWDEGEGEPRRPRLRHKLFEEVDRNSEDPTDTGMPFEFTLQGWLPTPNSQICNNELQDLKVKKTHNVNPLPAYMYDGNLIHPRNYQTELRDALVLVYMTFTHWYFGPSKTNTDGASDTYNADIINMKVLAPPRPRPAGPKTPVKRYAMTDPMASPSPPKRGRTSRS
ncbi:hypothetical protein PsYK624_164310 [Phanerochaete sordida]|uniref:Uncharacterized protein n=1 Tax=Phanerochaete sordida TaxID=48140 RepID=A0A9P3LM33_9APHY|nr:hypothetical protein PsYK624_164310 [Phanerochaete sordida]